jgi:hypothetical protein
MKALTEQVRTTSESMKQVKQQMTSSQAATSQAARIASR